MHGLCHEAAVEDSLDVHVILTGSRRFGSSMRLLSRGWPYNGSRIMGLECLRTASESPTTKRVPILRPSLPSLLQMFEQMLYQKPVHLVYPDPTACALDEAGPRARPEATVGDLELADVL